MKTTFAKMMLVLISLTAAKAQAATMSIDAAGIDVLNVLNSASVAPAYKKALAMGNRITSVTIDAPSGELTRYAIVVQQCYNRPGLQCLGGAQLNVVRTRVNSLPPHYEYDTQVLRLRGGR